MNSIKEKAEKALMYACGILLVAAIVVSVVM